MRLADETGTYRLTTDHLEQRDHKDRLHDLAHVSNIGMMWSDHLIIWVFFAIHFETINKLQQYVLID